VELAGEGEGVERLEDTVSRRDLSRAVARAMRTLPEDQRTAIVLKEYHGLTFQEISELLGCPLSTVKTRLYQGLTVLRRELEKNGIGSANGLATQEGSRKPPQAARTI
jgi:RNA polymerase sigma-70 factor, ECF subfamily